MNTIHGKWTRLTRWNRFYSIPTKLTLQEREKQLASLVTGEAGWELVSNRDAIVKTFLFKDFPSAFSFMSQVALYSEKMDHHPEVIVTLIAQNFKLTDGVIVVQCL